MKKIRSKGRVYDSIYVSLKTRIISHKRTKEAKKRVKRIKGGYNGSREEFKNVVVKYWAKYNIRPMKFWYDIYCDGKQEYDPRFVPDSMWYESILPYYNSLIMRRAYVDKGMYNRLFQNVKKPETIVKNVCGYFYNGDGEKLITREEAEMLCMNEDHLIFKPSLDSGGGRSICFFDKDKDGIEKIRRIIDGYGTGFVVQRIVKQHPELAKINEDSLNTIRVMSFHFKGKIHILSAQLRMGVKGSRVDNYSAGGCACAIKEDGWLEERAITKKSEWKKEHGNGLKYKDIHIPNYEGPTQKVKELHLGLPYFNLVGWDFAIGEDGSPIFMEFNVMPETNQIGSGLPTFGELSDEVFEDVFCRNH